MQREIDGLKLKRRDVETSIEATIQTLRNTLEFVREQEARERDDKILFHRPRLAEQSAGIAAEAVAIEATSRLSERAAVVRGRSAGREPRATRVSFRIWQLAHSAGDDHVGVDVHRERPRVHR